MLNYDTTKAARTNEAMKPHRFALWARNRRMLRTILDAFDAGHRVMLSTYLRSTVYQAKHRAMFSADRYGCYVQSGKRRLDITGCALRVFSA